MPYMKVHKGDKVCVHKQNADKSPGEQLHCYPKSEEDKADAYMRALYAHSEHELTPELLVELAGTEGGYLVTDDKGNKHLPTTIDGKISHRLMGAAWAALHGGYRGNKYEGPGKETAISKLKALYKRENMTPPSEQSMFSMDFMFTELGDPKPFDGMAAGKFTDMTGQTVNIKDSDLPAIVERTKASIESTRTESGEIVGLPIDPEGHNHQGGAGWIVDVSLDASGKKIRFTPKWTDIGLKLIKDNIRRFFSVSVDLINKVIMGGSLTNWPATRTKDGKILLRPIELSVAMFAIDESLSEKLQSIRSAFYAQFQPSSSVMSSPVSPSIYLDKIFDSYVICQESDNLYKVVYSTNAEGKIEFASHDKWTKVKITYQEITNMSKDDVVDNANLSGSKPEGDNQMTEPVVAPVVPVPAPIPAPAVDLQIPSRLNELLKTPEAIQEMGRQAELIAKGRVEDETRKRKIVEYASNLVGGTKDFPYGIPIPAEEVVALLVSLPPQQAEAVEIMLSKTMKAINFKEMGFSGEYNAHPRVPEEYRGQIKTWLDAGKDLSSFFTTNPEVGKEEDFNLIEFKPKEK